jgi:hypothetical protein
MTYFRNLNSQTSSYFGQCVMELCHSIIYVCLFSRCELPSLVVLYQDILDVVNNNIS